MQNFIDLSIINNTNKKSRNEFKDFDIDLSHYRYNAPKIIKSIPIDF